MWLKTYKMSKTKRVEKWNQKANNAQQIMIHDVQLLVPKVGLKYVLQLGSKLRKFMKKNEYLLSLNTKITWHFKNFAKSY